VAHGILDGAAADWRLKRRIRLAVVRLKEISWARAMEVRGASRKAAENLLG
jgi:hypothetical protein